MGLDEGMRNKKKREVVEAEEEKDSEDWCFECKDGGDLIICDYKDCIKVYHPGCVGKKKTFMNSGRHWTCRRHSCSVCSSTPRFYCLCCPNASLCRDCFSASEFTLLKGNNGLCKSCLKLVLLAEENSEYGLEGEKIDFKDRDTFECLFKECWEILKEQEGFTLDDVYSACATLKGKNHNCRFDSVNIGDSDESRDLTTSDGNTSAIEFQETVGKKKRFQPMEFIGWGSKPLIEFLRSIGKDTTKKLSRFEVESIISYYIKDNDLPKQKKMVQCDNSLYSIFKQKSINMAKLYQLLEEHFAEDIMVIEDSGSQDEDIIRLEDKNQGTKSKKRRVSSDVITTDENKAPSIHKSCFASIIAENMKFVYIRRSLLEELLKEPDHSESKILGCFVRVKNDPQDYLQRNSHQLSQVKGMKKITATNGADFEILLQVSHFTRYIPISLLSDSDFTQEECEDLRQHMAEGLLKKPTVVALQEKARVLHEDITKHWIQKELVRLQNRVDYTNEKGLRREYPSIVFMQVCSIEYLEQRERLKKPSEQERLLKQLPEVIPEVIDIESG
ncbi:putative chromatin regulator PHD family [Rosa chinensis]|uniref:Putative chromatin regulator PHD family n=1 Tax=Rosa chinensis TaxID=74649 RepID=A0A2P6PE40_ROSCH|nr:putative chromatin regulator PHD family [Rosa chinensis]